MNSTVNLNNENNVDQLATEATTSTTNRKPQIQFTRRVSVLVQLTPDEEQILLDAGELLSRIQAESDRMGVLSLSKMTSRLAEAIADYSNFISYGSLYETPITLLDAKNETPMGTFKHID